MNQHAPTQVIAVTGGKGGVGKTNIAVNLSVALSRLGRSVLLFDADLGLANVDLVLGLKSSWNISHVLSGERNLHEVVIEGPAGIRVIPASSGLARMARLGELELAGLVREFSQLEDSSDVLVVDTGAGLDPSVLMFCAASEEVVVVVCDEPASIADAYSLIKVLNQTRAVEKFQVIANMVEGDAAGRRLFAKLCSVTDRFLDARLHYLGAIPLDPYLRKAVQRRVPVSLAYPRAPASLAFTQLAERLSRRPQPAVETGGIKFFLERIVASPVSPA